MATAAGSYGFRNEADRTFPSMVVAELCNVCNLRCVHCAYREVSRRPDYQPAYLPYNLFTRVVDEVRQYPNSFLRFTSDGEPLLHPELPAMVAYAKRQGLTPVTINTNGQLLDGEKARALLVAGIDVVEISVNADAAETYERLRPPGRYAAVQDNIRQLLALREELGATTRVWVSTIVFPGGDAAAFRAQWQGQVDKVIVRPYFDHHGMVKDPPGGVAAAPAAGVPARFPCPQLWKRITVAPNGWLKYCVNDWLNETLLADLRTGVTIREVWQSAAYEKLRAAQLTGEYAGMKLCDSCTDWQAMDWNYDYNSAIDSVKQGD